MEDNRTADYLKKREDRRQDLLQRKNKRIAFNINEELKIGKIVCVGERTAVYQDSNDNKLYAFYLVNNNFTEHVPEIKPKKTRLRFLHRIWRKLCNRVRKAYLTITRKL